MSPHRPQLLRHALLAWLLLLTLASQAASPPSTPNDWITHYFRQDTARLEANGLHEIQTASDWAARRPGYRQQLQEMLGLHPWPERTPLQPVVTGTAETDRITVETLHFQSLPGLYVTANLYRPKTLDRPAPAILYVCGHGPVVKNGVSYGNKVAYQHHGAWLAENGYVCLVIDTLQLGEIQGHHHGTHRLGLWWWNSRGYTPAGVEAWNGIRALDYLESRPEVDRSRLGITGRSGGGAYSWTVAALDDRIRVAAPVAGITDLRNHVVDGTVEGHCDCMFFVNTFGWDYPQLAALVSPRPLLIANTDRDSIFPLDGVVRLHERVRRVYELQGARTNLGLLITEGPHHDTQDLQLPVLRWFNRFLLQRDPPIQSAATPRFQPEQLRVFTRLPDDARNTNIHATFVPLAPTPPVPRSAAEWAALQQHWMTNLAIRTFGNTPPGPSLPVVREPLRVERLGLRLRAVDFESHPGLPLRLYVLESSRTRRPTRTRLEIPDDPGWQRWSAALVYAFANELPELRPPNPNPRAPMDEKMPAGDPAAFAALQGFLQTNSARLAWFSPRGTGPHAWTGDDRFRTHLRRRFMLLGQTLDSMRVWDIRQAIRTLRSLERAPDAPLTLAASSSMAVNTLYASLFEPPVASLDLDALPTSHMQGPDYLNVLRILDLPQAVALAASRTDIQLRNARPADWAYPLETIATLGWPASRLTFP